MIVPIEEVFTEQQADAINAEQLESLLGKYRRTLQSDRRHLLEQFSAGPGRPQGRRASAASAPAPGSC